MEIKKFGQVHIDKISKSLFEKQDKNWIYKSLISCSVDTNLFSFSYKSNCCVFDKSEDEVYMIPKCTDHETEIYTSSCWFNVTVNDNEPKSFDFLLLSTNLGKVHFLSKRGNILDSKQYQMSPIVKIKQNQEDILVLYPGYVVKLENKFLSNFLLAKLRDEIVEDIPERRWVIFGQDLVNDLVWTREGVTSLLDLYKSKNTDSIVAVGKKPCISTYTNKEGQGTIISASRIASKVASKVSTAVFSMAKSWFMGNNETEAVEEKKKVPIATHGVASIQFNDHPREIRTISMDPHSQYAITTDTLGRVMILDLTYNLIVRIFKGYRDASCTWIVNENKCFVGIFSRRRGILEIWNHFDGSKVNSLNVGSDCHFFQAPTPNHVKRGDLKNGDSILITSDGIIYKIVNEIEVYDSEDHAKFEKFKTVIGSHKIMEQILKSYKSPKFLIQSVELLDEPEQKSLCELALFLCKEDRISKWFQNRIHLIEAFESMVSIKYGDAKPVNGWKDVIGKDLDAWSRLTIEKTLPSQFILSDLLKSCEFYGEKVKIQPHSLPILTPLFWSLLKGFQFYEKIEYLLNFGTSDLQEIFLTWILNTPLIDICKIDPKVMKKAISSLAEPKAKFASKIQKFARASPNSANVLLLLKLCDDHDDDLDKIQQIFFIQSHLNVELARSITLLKIEKEIPVYKLVALQNMSDPEKCKPLIERFECEETSDIIQYYSAMIHFERAHYTECIESLSLLTSTNQAAVSLMVLGKILDHRIFGEILLCQYQSIPQDFTNQLKFMRKIFKYTYQKIVCGEKHDYAEPLYEIRRKFSEHPIRHEHLDDILSMLCFIQIVLEIPNFPPFEMTLLFPKSTLNYISTTLPEDISQGDRAHCRKEYLKSLLECSYSSAIEISDIFAVSRDFVQTMYIKIHYEKLEDTLAEEILLLIRDKTKIATEMVEIARVRLGLILQFIAKNKTHIHLLSHVPTQIFQWMSQSVVDSDKISLVSTKYVHKTKCLLEKCIECLASKKDSVEYKKAHQMYQFIKNVSFE